MLKVLEGFSHVQENLRTEYALISLFFHHRFHLENFLEPNKNSSPINNQRHEYDS